LFVRYKTLHLCAVKRIKEINKFKAFNNTFNEVQKRKSIKMSIEIEKFIAEVKKTRDYSAFAIANPSKTSKQAEPTKHTIQTEGENTRITAPVLGNLFGEGEEIVNIVSESLPHILHQLEPNTEPALMGSSKLLKQDKIELIEDKTAKPMLQVKTVKPTQLKYAPFKISREFITYVQAYQVQDNGTVRNNRRIVIEEELHVQMMHLKHRTKIKSLSALVNVILMDFMNNNKPELQSLFAESVNRLNL
jgi:hypothetical protein